MSTAACGLFTTDSYVHAHDLGRVACVKCGRLFQEHNSDQRHSVPPMSDDVGMVVAEALGLRNRLNAEPTLQDREAAKEICHALAAAGYAVVAVPEGVAVAHGARLVLVESRWGDYYVIEDTP